MLDYALLLRRLDDEGLAVKRMGRVKIGFIQEQAYLAKVQNEELRVFEFKSAEAAANAATGISPDGYTYTTASGGASVSWVAPPHFFRAGRVIVLYLGRQRTTLDVLSRMLGQEFAGAGRSR